MFHMASESHISSLATSLLHSSCEADLALVSESGVSMAHSALLLPLLPDLASLLASCPSCSSHDPIVLILPDTATPPLLSALESVYLQADPAQLAHILGLGLQKPELGGAEEKVNNTDGSDIFEENFECDSIQRDSNSSPCPQCGKTFAPNETALPKDHKCDNVHWDEEEEKAKNIDNQLNSGKQVGTSSEEKLEPFSCRKTQRCKRSFLTESGLRKHILNYHEGERKYSCDICRKRFYLKKKKVIHEKIHEKKAIICPICGQEKRDLYRLQLHHQQLHIAEGSNCHRCERSFANRRDLRIHNKSCGRRESRALLRVKVEVPKAVLPKLDKST